VRALQLAQQVAVDLDLLQERLLELLRDPDLRRRMGRAGRQRVQQELSWEAVIAAQDELFEQQLRLAAEAPPPELPPPPTLWELFGHFPSRTLAAWDRLRLTSTGVAVMSGQQPPFVFLDQPWQAPLLQQMTFTSRPEGTPLADLLRPLEDQGALAQQDGLATVLWMLKRGWLQLCPR
jgi:hypothetical protein